MKESIKKRVIKEANYMLQTKDTIRNIAKKYNISKSTIHKDLSIRLKEIDKNKYIDVDKILKIHLKERHIKGGEVTKAKYKKR